MDFVVYTSVCEWLLQAASDDFLCCLKLTHSSDLSELIYSDTVHLSTIKCMRLLLHTLSFECVFYCMG